MPLAFESESHGTIAFGFFNIESDMLILDRYFLFAADFCKTIIDYSTKQEQTEDQLNIDAYVIEALANIGDLHGAIAGVHYSGFIGEAYKKYPFPKQQLDFKQQTRGFANREDFKSMILNFGKPCTLKLGKVNDRVEIGPYRFTEKNFSELINYVIQGGYPKWQDGIAPDYVVKMQQFVKL